PQGMDKIACLQVAYLRDHQCQKRVRSNIERHTQEYVGTALVKLATELAVGYIELEETVAGRKRHISDLGHIPCRNNKTPGIRVVPDLAEYLADLIDMPS